MSNIDLSRQLEAYHPDGRSFDTFIKEASSDGRIKYIGMIPYDDCPRGFRDDGRYALYRGDKKGGSHLWRIRNKAEPKADIPEWAIDKVRAMTGLMQYDHGSNIAGVVNAFARYIAKHEDPPVDPAEAIADELLLLDASTRTIILRAIERGRELERGEVK